MKSAGRHTVGILGELLISALRVFREAHIMSSAEKGKPVEGHETPVHAPAREGRTDAEVSVATCPDLQPLVSSPPPPPPAPAQEGKTKSERKRRRHHRKESKVHALSVKEASLAPPVAVPASGQELAPPAAVPVSGQELAPPAAVPVSGQELAPPAVAPVSGQELAPPAALPVSGQELAPPAAVPASGQELAPPAAVPASGQDASMDQVVACSVRGSAAFTSSQNLGDSSVVGGPQAEDAKVAGLEACLPEPPAAAPAVTVPKVEADAIAPSCPRRTCLRASKTASPKSVVDTLTAANDPILTARVDIVSTMVTQGQSASHMPRRCSLDSRVIGVVVFGSALVCFYLLLLPKPGRKTENQCTTDCCARHRVLIEGQLNRSVDPCGDFAAHVCSRWAPRKEFGNLSRSALADLVMEWLADVPNMLRKGVAHLPAGRKPVAMFNSCMTQTGSQVAVVKEFMSQHGLAWPEDAAGGPGPLDVLFDIAFNWNVNVWFSLKLISSSVNDNQRRLLYLAPNDHMLFWKAALGQMSKTRYETLYNNFVKCFASDKNGWSPAGIANDYNTLKYVFEILYASRKGEGSVPAVFSMSQLDKHVESNAAKDLRHAIDKTLRIEPALTMDDLLLVSDMNLLKGLFKIFGNVKHATVRRLLAWLFLQVYAAVANPAAILQILHGSGHQAYKERLRFCAGQVEASYKLLMSAMAAIAHFTEEERQRVESHLAAIQRTAVDKVSAASWLDAGTRRVASEKLSAVRTVLWPTKEFVTAEGLEEAYANFTDTASSFADFWIQTRRSQHGLVGTDAGLQELPIAESTAEPYAQYAHMLNTLSLSLGALAPPLYYTSGTKAMLHGGLGYFYAKELVRAVDTEGVKVDPRGNIVSSWLSNDVKPAFEDRVLGCLVGAESSIFPEVPAIEVAYAAFKRDSTTNDLPLSRDLTEEKVFFITACLISCSKTAADNVYGGNCNKAMANFAPFAAAFQCPLGSNMNPATKCSFFD